MCFYRVVYRSSGGESRRGRPVVTGPRLGRSARRADRATRRSASPGGSRLAGSEQVEIPSAQQLPPGGDPGPGPPAFPPLAAPTSIGGAKLSRESSLESRALMAPPAEEADAEVTLLLAAWRAGDSGALSRLMPLVYGELRRLAAHFLAAERPNHTLQATALVHEAYLRSASGGGVRLADRAHFFAVAAQVMRRLLVDHARGRAAAKRGGAGGVGGIGGSPIPLTPTL